MVKCNLIKLGVGWPEMWPERTDLRHKLVSPKKYISSNYSRLQNRLPFSRQSQRLFAYSDLASPDHV